MIKAWSKKDVHNVWESQQDTGNKQIHQD